MAKFKIGIIPDFAVSNPESILRLLRMAGLDRDKAGKSHCILAIFGGRAVPTRSSDLSCPSHFVALGKGRTGPHNPQRPERSRGLNPGNRVAISRGPYGANFSIEKFGIIGISLGIFVLLQSFAFADDDNLMNKSLEDLLNMPVTSATLTKTTQKISPGNTYIITSDEMDKMGADSITDVIDKMVPGMSLSLGLGTGTVIGVRGMSTDGNLKMLLLQDNVDLSDHVSLNSNGADLDTPFTGDVDRLEVTLGPGSLQLGSGAINGYINKVTSTGESRPGLRIHQMGGSGNARLTEVSYGKVVNESVNYFVYGGYHRNDGVAVHFNMTAEDMAAHGGAPSPPSETYMDHIKYGATGDDYRLSSRVLFNNPERGDLLSFDIKAFYSDTSISQASIDTPFIMPSSSQWRDEVQATLDDSNVPGALGWETSPFRFFRKQILSISPEMIVKLNPTNQVNLIPFYQRMAAYSYLSDWFKEQVNELGLDESQAKDISFGFQNRYGLKTVYNNTTFEHNNISLGSEVIEYAFKANRTFSGADGNMASDDTFFSSNQTRVQYSIFGEDIVTLGKFSVIPGCRYDVLHIGSVIGNPSNYLVSPQWAQHFTSRVAMAYQLTENDILKASYSEGYRFVDSAILQYYANNYTLGNQPIRPETSRNYELTYGKFLPGLKIKLDVTQFYNINKNAQGFNPAINNFGNATKEIRGIGQEYMVKYLPSKDLELFFSYAWSKPLSSYDGFINVANQNDTWSRYPEQMFKMGGYWTIGKCTLGSLLKLQSGTVIEPVDSFVGELYQGWTLQDDIKIQYAITKNWNIALTVKDIITSGYNQNNDYFQGQVPTMGLRPEDSRVYFNMTCKF